MIRRIAVLSLVFACAASVAFAQAPAASPVAEKVAADKATVKADTALGGQNIEEDIVFQVLEY